jgi:hypothetical protein
MVMWVLVKISAALTRAIGTFSLPLESLTYLFGGLGLMIFQKANMLRNQAFEGGPSIRLAYPIPVGKGKSQKLAKTKNIDYEEIDKKLNLRYAVKTLEKPILSKYRKPNASHLGFSSSPKIAEKSEFKILNFIL